MNLKKFFHVLRVLSRPRPVAFVDPYSKVVPHAVPRFADAEVRALQFPVTSGWGLSGKKKHNL